MIGWEWKRIRPWLTLVDLLWISYGYRMYPLCGRKESGKEHPLGGSEGGPEAIVKTHVISCDIRYYQSLGQYLST